jgi:hypothetical protein
MLQEKIQQDLKLALKEGKKVELSTLRMVLSAIRNKETEKRTKIWKEKPESKIETLEKGSKLTDEEVLEVFSSEVKQRKESCAEYEKGGRADLIEREKREIEIIQRYLPEQFSEEEVAKIAREVIAALRASLAISGREAAGANDVKDTGRIMAQLMPRVKGRADGGLVSRIVRELLDRSNKGL